MEKKRFILLLTIIILIIIIIFITLQLLKSQNPIDLEKAENSILNDDNSTIEKSNILLSVENASLFYGVENCIVQNLPNISNTYIIEMYSIDKVTNTTFFVYSIADGNEIYVVVNLDLETLAYNIEQITEDTYNKARGGTIDKKYLEDAKIELNSNNQFNYGNVTDEQICTKYMNMINYLLINNPDVIYKKIDVKYRQQRFNNSYNDFKQYCIDNKELIESKQFSSGSISYGEEYNTYTLLDGNSNAYVINQKSPGNFEILLDNYTIETNDFKNKYQASTDEVKVSTNIDKFIKMINTKDYNEAYALLDETYRNNNFSTITSFKNYISSNFYSNNIYTISNISQQGQYYVATIEIKESPRASANIITKKLIISLGEGTNFTMSIMLE